MGRQGPESRLVKQMRDEAKKIYGERLVTIKYHGSAYSEAGVSDLLCCIDGVFVAVEAKTPTGIVTIKQEAFGARVLRAGGVFAVGRTVEEFLETLDAATWRSGGLGVMNDPQQ